jgi:hypothetical protein
MTVPLNMRALSFREAVRAPIATSAVATLAEPMRLPPELITRPPALVLPIPPQPAAAPAPAPQPAPPAPVLPPVPDENPFAGLPFPSPGDRIRAEDFRRISTCLSLIHDATLLSAALFGRTLAEARPFLAAQNRRLARVMTVLGSVLENVDDTRLDGHRVFQVIPMTLGEPDVHVVVTEAIETQRLTPDLTTAPNYEAASAMLRATVGPGPRPGTSITAPSLVGRTLDEARHAFATS